MAKTVVILGAGWAGVPLAHKLLKYTVPKLPVKVILVSPNSHFFWNVAATRGVIPDAIPDDQLFLPIKPAFDHYPSSSFEFVLGRADSIKPAANTVHITLDKDIRRDIAYDQLVIATGSRLASNLPLKPIGTHQETVAAWQDLQNRVGSSRSIVIAGAGPTGVEVAGELAARYGTSKAITLVVSGDQPMEGALGSVRATVARDLKSLGVKLVLNARVTEAKDGSGTKQTELTLSNGTTLAADLYLPFHGIKLNTSFLPKEWLDSSGNVKLDGKMRVSGTENVWGIGDVGSIEPKQLTVTDNQIIHLAAALDAALTGVGAVKDYVPENKAMVFLALGRNHATGQIVNWRLFSFIIAYVKARKLFVDTAEGYVGGKHLRHASM
ncbi:hypothetical protein ACJ41O_000695 [Fusarium nematophilum]